MSSRVLAIAVLLGVCLLLFTVAPATAAQPSALVYHADDPGAVAAPLDGAHSRARIHVGPDAVDGVTAVRYEARAPDGASGEATTSAAPFEVVLDLAATPPGDYVITAHVATAAGERTLRATVSVPGADAGSGSGSGSGSDDGTAAQKFRWGDPVWHDDFDGTSPGSDWSRYDSAGNGGNGLRRPSQVTVADGVLTQTGTADATSAGMVLQGHDATLGRWEVRVRAAPTAGGAGGSPYHPVVALIPTQVPYNGGERDIDVAEGDVGAGTTYLFIHYPPRKQDFSSVQVDMSTWHTFAVEIARNRVTWFVDGVPRITDDNPGAVPTTPLALNVQLDANATRLTPATLQLDWARYYPPPTDDATPATPLAGPPQTGDYG